MHICYRLPDVLVDEVRERISSRPFAVLARTDDCWFSGRRYESDRRRRAKGSGPRTPSARVGGGLFELPEEVRHRRGGVPEL